MALLYRVIHERIITLIIIIIDKNMKGNMSRSANLSERNLSRGDGGWCVYLPSPSGLAHSASIPRGDYVRIPFYSKDHCTGHRKCT